MKKFFNVISILLCCVLLFGCSAEDKAYDKDFLKDLKQGLMSRWDMAVNVGLDSKESGEKLVNAELNKIEKYLTMKFENTNLQEKAIGYINLLKKQKEALGYYDIDAMKYSELWDEALADRSTYIMEFINEYGVEFPDKYKEQVEEFTVRAKTVEENEALNTQIEEIKKSIEFKKVEQSGSYAYYEAIVENTTEKTFDTFSVEINLLDSDDVIIESNYASVNNWAPGKKAKLEFMSDANFESYEITVNYYIN